VVEHREKSIVIGFKCIPVFPEAQNTSKDSLTLSAASFRSLVTDRLAANSHSISLGILNTSLIVSKRFTIVRMRIKSGYGFHFLAEKKERLPVIYRKEQFPELLKRGK
jgi:hypothetical protein